MPSATSAARAWLPSSSRSGAPRAACRAIAAPPLRAVITSGRLPSLTTISRLAAMPAGKDSRVASPSDIFSQPSLSASRATAPRVSRFTRRPALSIAPSGASRIATLPSAIASASISVAATVIWAISVMVGGSDVAFAHV